MRINFLSRFFSGPTVKNARNTMTSVSQKVSEIKSRINLEKKAEELLQSRLTDWHALMRDVRSGDFIELNTGKKFTGKFVVKADELEQLHKVKDGKLAIFLVREKNGTKQFAAMSSGKTKSFTLDDEPSPKWGNLSREMSMADEQMKDKFVISELMKSGKDSIVIQGNY